MGTEASFPPQSGRGWLLLLGSLHQSCANSEVKVTSAAPHWILGGSPSHLPNKAIQAGF